MKQNCLWFSSALFITSFFGHAQTQAATFGSPTLFASGSAVGANVSGPDSVTVANGSVWVSYVPSTTSSSDFTGASTVVQYSSSGTILHTYTLPGSVDGLKINPSTGAVWALQNQDGNSRLTVIDPSNGNTTSYNYAPPVSAGQGFDDVVFAGGQTYLSYTNPTLGTDPVLQTLNGLTTPFLTVNPLATFSAHPSTLSDPDSLKADNQGNLVLTSGSDGALNFFSTSGAFQKSISIKQNGNTVGGLDDSLFPTAGNGVIYFTDTATNSVYTVNAFDLSANAIYASVGSAHAIGSVDPSTGIFTPVISDGASNSSPHGIAFVSTPEPGTWVLMVGGILLVALGQGRRKRLPHTV
jgi:hypothetical protein